MTEDSFLVHIPRAETRTRAHDAAAPERRSIVRFDVGDRAEHVLLILSFSALALTGLAQKFADGSVGLVLLMLLGGIETARLIHRLAATLLILESIFHLLRVAYKITVRRSGIAMGPKLQDLRDFIQMLLHFVGRSEHPRFGRYTYEEKVEYWALVWGTVVMILTGLVMWFPSEITQFVTGEIVPVARAAHGGEALLAVLSILTWHFYHTLVKTRNWSIFTGRISAELMQEEHAREYERLIAKQAFGRLLKRAAQKGRAREVIEPMPASVESQSETTPRGVFPIAGEALPAPEPEPAVAARVETAPASFAEVTKTPAREVETKEPAQAAEPQVSQEKLAADSSVEEAHENSVTDA